MALMPVRSALQPAGLGPDLQVDHHFLPWSAYDPGILILQTCRWWGREGGQECFCCRLRSVFTRHSHLVSLDQPVGSPTS